MVLTLSQFSADGVATLTVQGTPSSDFAVQRSLSALDWTPAATGTLDGSGLAHLNVTNTEPNTMRFYRVRLDGGGGVDVYSVNIVGYANRVVAPGGDYLANQFTSLDPTVGSLLLNLSAGVSIFKVSGNYEVSNYLEAWSDANMTLHPGEGWFLRNPYGTNLTVTFVGEVSPGNVEIVLPAGPSVCSSVLPLAGPLGTGLGFPTPDGVFVQVDLYEPSSETYVTHGAFDGFWFPSEPEISVGQSFWSYRDFSAVWTNRSLFDEGTFFTNYVSPFFGSPAGLVNFFTFDPDPAMGRVSDTDGITPVNSAFLGQIYAGTNATEAALSAVGTPVAFLSGQGAGYIRSGLVSVPNTSGGQTIYYQLRAWDSSSRATYEAAVANGGKAGKSAIVSTVAGGGLRQLPPNANGFESFSVEGLVPPPSITTQPLSHTVLAGTNVSFFVLAGGTAPLSYQWWFESAAIPWATNTSYERPNVQPEHAGSYWVVVSNEWGRATSSVAVLTVVPPPPIPVTNFFAGPLKIKDSTPGATYDGVQINDLMRGSFIIGGAAAEGTVCPPDSEPNSYCFDSSVYFGTLIGDWITTSTRNSSRPLEVSFHDDVAPDSDELVLFNQIFGVNLPPGTQFDVAQIETDITVGSRRIEFGVSLLFTNLNYFTNSAYGPFPPLGEADFALYFVVEEVSDEEIYTAHGILTEFGLGPFPTAQCLGGDDFNDNVKDIMRWGEDITDPNSPSQAEETNGRLQFSGTDFAFRPWICSYGSYLQDWEVVADVHLGEVLLTEDESHVEVLLGVINRADEHLEFGVPGDHLVIALDLYRDDGGTVERSFASYLRTNWVSIGESEGPATDTRHASLRITFTATNKTLTAWYDADGSANGYSWTALRTARIGQPEGDWEMDDSATFQIVLGYSCTGFTVDASHEVWADNFVVSGTFFTAPVLRITQTNGAPVLHLSGDAGRQYAIEYKSSLAAASNWQTLTNLVLTNNTQAVGDPPAVGVPTRYYRARVTP